MEPPRRRARRPQARPVLLALRERAESIVANPAISLPDVIRAAVGSAPGKEPGGWWERQLERGRCLILLDGLDEVARADDRLAVAEWIERQIAAHPDNHFVVTSRSYDLLGPLAVQADVLVARPFTAKQVQLFLDRWYLAAERHATGASGRTAGRAVQLRARESAERLNSLLQANSALRDLAVNPLLLTMIATAHRYRGALPGSRADLYGEICQVLLSRRAQAKDLPELLSWPAKQMLLASLAYQMMRDHASDLPAARVLEILGAAAGALLLVGHRRGVPRQRRAQRPAGRAPDGPVRLHPPDVPGVPGRPARQRQLRPGQEPRRQRQRPLVARDASCCTRPPPTPARSSAPASTAARSPPSRWPSTAPRRAPRSILTCGGASTGNASGRTSRTAPPQHRRLIAGVQVARLVRQTLTTDAGTRICARPVPADLYWLFLADTAAPRPDRPCAPDADQPATGIWGTEAQAFVAWANSITATATGLEVRLPRREELQEEGIAGALARQLPAAVTSTWTQPDLGTVGASRPAPPARADRRRDRPGDRRRRQEHRDAPADPDRDHPRRRLQHHPRSRRHPRAERRPRPRPGRPRQVRGPGGRAHARARPRDRAHLRARPRPDPRRPRSPRPAPPPPT